MAQKNPINSISDSRPLAVITGAASGFGYELAQAFAKNNFDLIVTDYNPAIVEAAEAFRAFGGLVEHIQTNLGAFKGVDGLIQKIQSVHRPIDTVVFNAHVITSGGFSEIPMEEELNSILVNITSVVHLAKHVVQEMKKEHRGRLLFTTGHPEKEYTAYHSVYEASKAFIKTFADNLQTELKDQGITVESFTESSDPQDAEAAALKTFNAIMSERRYVEEHLL